MPRKSKNPKKVKNIIQSVVVNISDLKTKKPRKRRARKSAPKQEIDVNARVSPAVVYFQAPSVNLPNPFSQPAPTPFLEQPVKLVPPVKSDTLAVLGDVVSQAEFTPTANFVSEKDKIKSQSSIIKPIDIQKAFDEPKVFGSSRFGNPNNETLTVSDYPTERLYESKPSSSKTKSFKSMKKVELQDLYRNKMGSDPEAKTTRFGLIKSLEKEYNL